MAAGVDGNYLLIIVLEDKLPENANLPENAKLRGNYFCNIIVARISFVFSDCITWNH